MSLAQFVFVHKAALIGQIRSILLRRRGVNGITAALQRQVDDLFALNKAKQQEALALFEKSDAISRKGSEALNEAKRAAAVANRFQDLLEG